MRQRIFDEKKKKQTEKHLIQVVRVCLS